MKYGVLSFGNQSTNIGDYIQSLGVLEVYKRMGLSEEDIVTVDCYDLSGYAGEEVVLPIAAFWDKRPDYSYFPISKKIKPVFLGVHCTDEKVLKNMGGYKSCFWGCRDLETKRAVSRAFSNEANVFMSGCFTLCLEKRDDKINPKKVYMIDVLDDFISYIPKELAENAETLKQLSLGLFEMDNDAATKKDFKLARERIACLKQDAKLVITSRLHVALPCIAMGIPVVVARRNSDDTERFSGYDGLFHVYMPHEWNEVDWMPVVPDIESLKEEIITNAIELLQNTCADKEQEKMFVEAYKKKITKADVYFEKHNVPYYSGEYAGYLSQQQKEYYFHNKEKYANILEFIASKKLSDCTLAIWGAGDKGFWMINRYDYIMNAFQACFYVDKNPSKQNTKIGAFGIAMEEEKELISRRGKYDIVSPEVINSIDKNKIIVIIAINHYYSKAGQEIFKELSGVYGLTEGKEFFFLDKLDSSARMAIDDSVLNTVIM